MKVRKHHIVLTTVFLALSTAFTNCGQPGEVRMEEQPLASLGHDDIAPIPHPEEPEEPSSDPAVIVPPVVNPPIQEQVKRCQDLIDSGEILTAQQTVRFEDTKVESGRSKVCNFAEANKVSKDGNLSMRNVYLRSRYTQNQIIDLPANAVICDMDIESPEQNFNYDDVFFLTLNQSILASNHKKALKEVLSPEIVTHGGTGRNISLYTYDWLKLRNTFFANVANDFCLGEEQNLSTCQWPVTQEYGKLKLKFDSEILIRLSQKQIANQQKLSFVITGDDDPKSDCYHQRLDLNLQIKYFVK